MMSEVCSPAGRKAIPCPAGLTRSRDLQESLAERSRIEEDSQIENVRGKHQGGAALGGARKRRRSAVGEEEDRKDGEHLSKRKFEAIEIEKDENCDDLIGRKIGTRLSSSNASPGLPDWEGDGGASGEQNVKQGMC